MNIRAVLRITGLVLFGTSAFAAPNKVTYFLESRLEEGADARVVRKAPDANAEIIYSMRPGDLLRLDSDLSAYNLRLRNEQAGGGTWVKVNLLGDGSGYIFDNWKSYLTIDPLLQPLQLTFAARHQDVITVFNSPGFISWHACEKQSEACIAWPVRDADMHLVDTRLLPGSDGKRRLFYQVQFSYRTENGITRAGKGWVPGAFVKRKIGSLPLLEKLAAGQFEVDDSVETPIVEREKVQELIRKTEQSALSQMSFSGTTTQELRDHFSRWVTAAPDRAPAGEGGQSLNDVLHLKIDLDVYAKMGVVGLTKHSAQGDAHAVEDAVRVGFSGIAPVMLDLEAAGALEYARGISRLSGTSPLADIFTFNQHVLYTFKDSPKGSAVKAGLGWNLLSLTRGGTDYGLTAAVGVYVLTAYESAKGFAEFKLGPVANSSGVSFKNYEAALGGGLRLKPELGYRSWSVTGNADIMSMTSKVSGDRTQIWTLLLGLRRTF